MNEPQRERSEQVILATPQVPEIVRLRDPKLSVVADQFVNGFATVKGVSDQAFTAKQFDIDTIRFRLRQKLFELDAQLVIQRIAKDEAFEFVLSMRHSFQPSYSMALTGLPPSNIDLGPPRST